MNAVSRCRTLSTARIGCWAAAALTAAALFPSGVSAARRIEPPEKALRAAAFIAGKPVQIACDADVNAAGGDGDGWTTVGGSTMHLVPERCADLALPLTEPEFVRGIGVLIHEAAHDRGVSREACAELVADIGVFDVLRLFWGVPFFSAQSARIGDQVLAQTHRRPAAYQPEGCT